MSLDDLPRLVTKHCTPEVREWMLEGRFKIGHHADYGGGTTSINNDRDGVGGIALLGNVKNITWTDPFSRNKFVVGSITGSKVAVAVDTSVNLNMFCCSSGAYQHKRHKKLRMGVGQYVGDPSLSAHIVLDVAKLHYAFGKTMNALFGGAAFLVGPVSYDGRSHALTSQSAFANLVEADINAATIRSAFGKPSHYAIEDEVRWIFAPANRAPIANIFTKDLSPTIQSLYRDAIYNRGSVA